ncbi:MAG: Uma2 family endonuclease, partial [Acidobacteriota bacterium]|nr:Uma2 family endonuclease [Acidobacteriota bacterium]
MSRMTGHQHTDDAGGSQRRLTYADFRRFPNDGQRHELINGKHAVTPAPEIRHQELSIRLVLALGTFLEAHPIGLVLHAPLDCVFSFFDVVEPDLLVVTNDQRGILTKRNIRGAPALVIEILSPGSSARDKRTKRALYERV